MLAELSKIKRKIAVRHDDLGPHQWGIKKYTDPIGRVSTGRNDFSKNPARPHLAPPPAHRSSRLFNGFFRLSGYRENQYNIVTRASSLDMLKMEIYSV